MHGEGHSARKYMREKKRKPKKTKITSPQHNIATSAIGRKRPQQITRTSHVVGRVRVHVLPPRERRVGKVSHFILLFCFVVVVVFLFSTGCYDISVKCKDTVTIRLGLIPSVSATYDTVNNLHYKAHS